MWKKSRRYQLTSSFCRLIFDIWTSLRPCPQCWLRPLCVTCCGNILGLDSFIFSSRPKDKCFKWGQQDVGQRSQDRIWFKEVCRSANLNKFQLRYALLTGHQALPSFFIFLYYCIGLHLILGSLNVFFGSKTGCDVSMLVPMCVTPLTLQRNHSRRGACCCFSGTLSIIGVRQ